MPPPPPEHNAGEEEFVVTDRLGNVGAMTAKILEAGGAASVVPAVGAADHGGLEMAADAAEGDVVVSVPGHFMVAPGRLVLELLGPNSSKVSRTALALILAIAHDEHGIAFATSLPQEALNLPVFWPRRARDLLLSPRIAEAVRQQRKRLLRDYGTLAGKARFSATAKAVVDDDGACRRWAWAWTMASSRQFGVPESNVLLRAERARRGDRLPADDDSASSSSDDDDDGSSDDEAADGGPCRTFVK